MIQVAPSTLLQLLEEVGRHRALLDHETDLVEAIVCRGHPSAGIHVTWTRRLDRLLIAAAETKGGIRRFATKNGIEPGKAYDRLHRLRKAKQTAAEGVRTMEGL